ncbi:MAG: hypothetical protein AAF570_24445 [Bacteroidota bacterium]
MIRPLNLGDREKTDLEAFLGSLSGERITMDVPEVPVSEPLPAPYINHNYLLFLRRTFAPVLAYLQRVLGLAVQYPEWPQYWHEILKQCLQAI